LAELYQSEDALEPGDIVTMDRDVTDPKLDPKFAITKSQKSDAMPVMGAISTKPGVVLGSLDFDSTYKSYPVALKGRTPVKVISYGGTIKKGDPIGISPVKGYGMKPEKQGYVVGYALEEFNPETSGVPCPAESPNMPDGSEPVCGSVMTFMQQELYDPKALVLSAFTDEALSALKFEEIKQSSSSGIFAFSETVLQFAQDAVAATNGFFLNLKAGTLDVGELRIGGKTLREYITDTIYNLQFPISKAPQEIPVASDSGQLALQSVRTATDSGVVLGVNLNQPTATISAQTGDQSATASASFANTLFGMIQSLKIKGDALIEGILTVFGKAIFKAPVTVEDSILFPSNMGGSFVIPSYISKVRVSFDTSFESTPSVSLTPVLSSASDSAYLSDAAAIAVSDVTVDGFTAILDFPVMHDITYSFTALQISGNKPSKTTLMDNSSGILGSSVTLEASPSSTVSTSSGDLQ
jgi:hypothetical protein